MRAFEHPHAGAPGWWVVGWWCQGVGAGPVAPGAGPVVPGAGAGVPGREGAVSAP